ncbi:hypothetical protein HMN09_01152100 [Mycena chlorophos]|uniref:F-box domain-containing protein n=1 Tax=Mycena chlorophos TaxID=658473 RepID=A0A8H6S9G8_MYCCL|nr:hypothetical protein HMN09_01152100 [Mycena chlorophos]
MLSLILADLHPGTRLMVSGLSRRLRTVLSPTLFQTVRWAPLRRGFPPEILWPHIQVLILAGDMNLLQTEQGTIQVTDLDYAAITAAAKDAIPRLPALRSFEITNTVAGGLWPELFEVLTLSPTLTGLHLKANWYSPRRRATFGTHSTHSTLQTVVYPLSNFRPMVRRQPIMLDVEGTNLHFVLEGCRTTLENATIPGELLLRAMDYSQPWKALQKLAVDGFWPHDLEDREMSPYNTPPPQDMRSQLVRVLEALPNLRVAAFKIWASNGDRGDQATLVGPNHSPPRSQDRFLRHLELFQFSTLQDNDRILEFLPQRLRTLSLPRYISTDDNEIRQPILPASALLQLLERVDFPDLEVLEVNYLVHELAEVDDQDTLLSLLPNKFPRLRHLAISRFWDHDESDLDEHWDPVPVYRKLLSRLPELRFFRFSADVPERSGQIPFIDYGPPFVAHIERLRKLGEGIVRDCPWLSTLSLYRQFRSDPRLHWEYWSVVLGPGGDVRLQGTRKYT